MYLGPDMGQPGPIASALAWALIWNSKANPVLGWEWLDVSCHWNQLSRGPYYSVLKGGVHG